MNDKDKVVFILVLTAILIVCSCLLHELISIRDLLELLSG